MMIRVAAFITVTMMSFAAYAAEDTVHEATHDLAEGIHDAEHASSGGLPQFDPTWFASQVFWLAVSFALLYFIFAKKTLPDISGVIENRKNHIQSDLETAEKLTAQADAVHDAYMENLTKAQNEAAKAVQSVESKMKKKSEKAMDDFRARSEKEVQEAERRIESAKQTAMGDMNAIVAETASIAVEKIIGTNADVKQVQAIVENMSGNTKAKAA